MTLDGTISTDSEIEGVPIATQRAFDAKMQQFNVLLTDRSVLNMRTRGSETPTDADVDAAFREIIGRRRTSKVKRAIGDVALIVGGVLLPMWGPNGALTGAGLGMCVMGLYVRECDE